ncbi:hypothetical protein CSPX01_14281 [Colletotrichum filicis]|nr:hypothetical protein CSPX01_14281 [Colletotrichum filicis]
MGCRRSGSRVYQLWNRTQHPESLVQWEETYAG